MVIGIPKKNSLWHIKDGKNFEEICKHLFRLKKKSKLGSFSLTLKKNP